MKKLFFIMISACYYSISFSQTSGGPDAFGYTWHDSNDPNGPVYSWIDITTLPGAVQVTGLGDDNMVGPINVPFLFEYYSGFESQIRIGSNGYVSFNNSMLASPMPVIPATALPNNFIAPFLVDLTFVDNIGIQVPGASCWYWCSPAHDSLIISWIDVPFWDLAAPNYSGLNTFQVVLTSNPGDILFQYKQQSGVPSQVVDICSIGIENATGQIGLGVSHDVLPDTAYAILIDIPPSNLVQGYCFVDDNLNGVMDINENGYSHLTVVSSGNGNVSSCKPLVSGLFTNRADSGFITTTIPAISNYSITPVNHNSVFTGFQNIDSVNFALVPVGIVDDLVVSLFPLGNARPGFDVTYRLNYLNLGTVSESGSLYLMHDQRLTLIYATDTIDSYSGDSLVFNYQNLLPGEDRNIDVVFYVGLPPLVNIGDSLSSRAFITPVINDVFPADNTSLLHQTVTGSYDPNDKTMLDGGSITTTQVAGGDFMHYLVRFQNTGTDTAFTVIVVDTLSGTLEWSSLEMISASHPCLMEIKNGNIITWKFYHALIPDSNVNEPGSHGYIYFRIKPSATLQAGSVIDNTSSIYFDNNLPVTTNTSHTTVIISTSVENEDAPMAVELFPNPSDGNFVLYGAPIKATLKIYDITGRMVYSDKISSSHQHLQLKASDGIYFLEINSGNKFARKKFVLKN